MPLVHSLTLTLTEQLLGGSALTIPGDAQMNDLVPDFEELTIKQLSSWRQACQLQNYRTVLCNILFQFRCSLSLSGSAMS